MISISKLYCGRVEPGDVLRYEKSGRKLPTKLLHSASVLFWILDQKNEIPALLRFWCVTLGSVVQSVVNGSAPAWP